MSEEEKNWVLDYLCGSKGVIPYEDVRSHENLDKSPRDELFAQTEFFSLLKNAGISDDVYAAVKKLWKLLRLEKFSDLNDLYNFQDTIILCEIFENRA